MNQTERLYQIDLLIRGRGVIPFEALRESLEVSRATLKRDLAHLRDRLNAPIVFDREQGGYRLNVDTGPGPKYQLPGMWFSPNEALALLTMHQMLESLDSGGLLGPHIAPLKERLIALLASPEAPATEFLRRVRLMPSQVRKVPLKWFEVVGPALLKRKRLQMTYFTRSRTSRGEREVSPLRLVNYRHNWYLDAWCHTSAGIRMFSMDSIEEARMLDSRAKDVSLAEIDRQIGAGYGIYRDKDINWAVLRFNAAAATWVRAEVWHERQKGRDLDGGGYELSVPYSKSPELVMDVLRHGENVEVVGPAELRKEITRRLRAAAEIYS